MALIDPILEELTREAETTRRVLTRLPADKLAFKPHVKSKSLGDLAWHLATIPGRIAAMAQVDDADALAFKAPPKPETPQAIVDGFDAGVREATHCLRKASKFQCDVYHRGRGSIGPSVDRGYLNQSGVGDDLAAAAQVAESGVTPVSWGGTGTGRGGRCSRARA